MSGTLTVKELIKELLEYDMDASVRIGFGETPYDKNSTNLREVTEGYSGTLKYVVYLVPEDDLTVTEG
jgi:hypothetical protein